MRRRLVVGNWKMHGSRASATALAAEVAAGTKGCTGVDVGVCPPAILIPPVVAALAGGHVACGGQDVSEHESGAYTGETAAGMLVDAGCTLAIVGHSERRQFFGDTNDRVAAKLVRAAAAGLTPILCVGETLAERRKDETSQVIAAQLAPVLALPNIGDLLARMVIAYEPVWAIGTGETATPEQAQEVHAFIRGAIAARDATAAGALRILYGGSVKPDNAAALFAKPDVDGGLVGGAALKAADFTQICAAAAR
jgi:triosephosphate isomerase